MDWKAGDLATRQVTDDGSLGDGDEDGDGDGNGDGACVRRSGPEPLQLDAALVGRWCHFCSGGTREEQVCVGS